MVLIRLEELRGMSEEALKAKLSELELEVSREKGVIKRTGKPTNPGKFREMKKVIARIKTIMKQKGIKE